MKALKMVCLLAVVAVSCVAFDNMSWRLGLAPPDRCPECGGAVVVSNDGVLQTHSCELCRYGTVRQIGANNGKWR